MESKKSCNTNSSVVIKPCLFVVMNTNHCKNLYDEGVTTVSVDDEAAGCFIVISQDSEKDGLQKIRLDFDEIKPLYSAMEKLRDLWYE